MPDQEAKSMPKARSKAQVSHCSHNILGDSGSRNNRPRKPVVPRQDQACRFKLEMGTACSRQSGERGGY